MASSTSSVQTFLKESAFLIQREKYSQSDMDLRLRQASYVGDLEEVNKLLLRGKLTVNACQTGINPTTNKPYSQSTALHQAVIGGHAAIAVRLISAGWELDSKNIDGKTALELATPQMQKIMQSIYALKHINLKLKEIMKQVKLTQRLPLDVKKPLRVLSLACGIAMESISLNELLPDYEIHFKAVDINPEMLLDTFEMCLGIPNLELIEGDATDLEWLKTKFEERFDLVILRQPDILNSRKAIFSTILAKIVPAMMKPDGIFFLSCYHREELEACVPFLGDKLVPIKQTFCNIKGGSSYIIEGDSFNPDQWSLLLSCAPQFKKQLTDELAASSSTTKSAFACK